MRKKNHSTTVYLERYQVAALKALSQQTGVSVAAYVRQGIDKILEQHQGERDGLQRPPA